MPLTVPDNKKSSEQPASVQVLLSTYNGAAYLRPQLDSLLAQTHKPAHILMRDDGSTDGTRAILEEYERHSGIPSTIIHGENLGSTQSFFTLLQKTAPEHDYFAFCDQDDVWLPDKIARAIEMLTEESHEQPLLYCSRLRIVDENLTPLGLSAVPKRPLSLANALVENVVTGCTAVFNRQAREYLAGKIPKQAMHHDWWVYLVVSSLGKVIHDERPNILYRQHAGNVTGMPTGMALWQKRLEQLYTMKHRGRRDAQARDFKELYGAQLDARQQALLRQFIDRNESLMKRIKYAARPGVYRQTMKGNIMLSFMLLMDKL